jgi:hypothetical protein
MIELSSAFWKLEIGPTLYKLRGLGLPIAEAQMEPACIADYLRDHVTRRKNVAGFWQQAQDYLLQSGAAEIQRLCRYLHVQPSIYTTYWQRHGGQYLGAASKALVMEHLAPGRLQARKSIYPAPKPRSGSFLPGRGWKEMLVMPFWDLPGRFSGFLFLGNDPVEVLYYPVTVRAGSSPKYFEAGLSFLPAALQEAPHPLFGNALIVCTDPCIVAQLQFRHLRENTRPLPMVGAYYHPKIRTQLPWDWLATDDLIAWSPSWSRAAFLCARQARAGLSPYTTTGMERSRLLQQRVGTDWLRTIIAKATTWQQALRRCLPDATGESAEELFAELELQGQELRTFLQESDDALRQRFEQLLTSPRHGVCVRYSGQAFCELDDAWYKLPDNQLICGCVVRIEQTLVAPNRRKYYKGSVRYRGETFTFTELAPRIERRGLLRWACDYVASQGRRQPVYANAWNRAGVNLAMTFHAPVVATAAERVGWDGNLRAFTLPQFAVHRGGDVVREPLCLFDEKTAPARNIAPVEALTPDDLRALATENDETRLFWATLTCVFQNIVAPAFGQPACSIYLDGLGAQIIGNAVVHQCGCLAAADPRQLRHALRAHSWPVLWTKQVDDVLGQWFTLHRPQHLILMPTPSLARLLGIRGHWTGVSCPRACGSLQKLCGIATRALPAYLRYFCRQRHWLPNDGLPTAENLLADLAEWMEQCAPGCGQVVLGARHYLETPAIPAWQHFVRLVGCLVEEGLIVPVRASGASAPAGLVSFGDGRLWISQDRFSTRALRLAGLAPDLTLITDSLKAAGVLLSEEQYHEEFGWVIREAWWSEQFRKLNVPPQPPQVQYGTLPLPVDAR